MQRSEAYQSHGRPDEWHDPVTGLPCPRSFLQHLERLSATPERSRQQLAMLLLEVAVVDMSGEQLGEVYENEVLRTVAERLHAEVPEPMLVTRLDGGKFAVVLHDLGPEMAPEALATRLMERAGEPWHSGEVMSRCTVAGALVLSDGGQETAMQLLDRALRTLGRAKLRLAGRAR
jgi:diguanylate cyclase (GGDEF)-like protein